MVNKFLRCVVKGYVSLYMIREDIDKTGFYIQKLNDQTVKLEIIDTVIYYPEKNKDIHIVNKKYRGVLSYLFSDCKSTANRVNSVTLDIKSLVNIIADYNGCKRTGIKTTIYIVQKEKIKYIGIVIRKSIIKNPDEIFNGITFCGYYDIIFPETNVSPLPNTSCK